MSRFVRVFRPIARSNRARPGAERGGDGACAVVRVVREGRGFVGHLHFEDAGTSTSPRVFEMSFGASVAVEAASLASLVPSGRVFLEGTLREQARLFAPSLRLFVARSLDVDQTPRIGTASMTWTTGGIDACPIRVQLASTVSVRPCAEIAAGAIAARASGVVEAKNRSRAWVAIDVHGRLAWELARFLALEAEAGLTAPLIRESFFFLPSTDVYQAPIIGYFGRVGASVRFP